MENKHEQVSQPDELILSYASRKKLPEVSMKDISNLPKEQQKFGYAVSYEKGGVFHHASIRELMVTPEDPPVALSFLGTGNENERE